MPAKILLADKSITIQKVVEMLFAGREYEVVSVSDGETALSAAQRVVPDVVLADVDLPRVDGYAFAERLKKVPSLARTPVILMMSRDDVYDASKGKQAGILDNIVKPFESQELIGKVKKALAAAPPRLAEPSASRATADIPPKSAAPARTATTAVPPAAAATKAPPPAATLKPAPATPNDIFDIIDEAPTPSELKQAAAAVEDESVYEVEPVVEEVEEPLPREVAKALPIGPKAVEEMRAGLGLAASQEEAQPEIVTFDAFDDLAEAGRSTAPAVKPAAPAVQPTLSESELRSMAEETIAKMAKDVFAKLPPIQPPRVSDESFQRMVEEKVSQMAKAALEKTPGARPPALSPSDMWSVAEEAFAKIAKELFEKQPPPTPKVSDEAIRRGLEDAIRKVAREVAKEVIEQVAWEVIPQLAEQMIKEEIERLKAMEP
ncbi:MAG TPA: response regulator [Nitrospirota bacterium]